MAACVLALVLTTGCSADDGEPSNVGIVWAGEEGIEAVGLNGSDRRRISPRLGDDHGSPAWSRDGRSLAFWIRNSDSVEIHVLRPEDDERRVVSPTDPRGQFAYILDPNWPPDGEHLVVSDFWTLEESAIRVVSVSAGRWRSVTSPRTGRADTQPAWSPDGRRIAFVRERIGDDATPVGPPSIYLIGSDGKDLSRLTRGGPPRSPDNERIAYVMADSVYRIGADGGGRTRIIGGLKSPRARWSPDGRRLPHTTAVGEGLTDVWVMDLDGTNRRQLLRRTYVSGVDWQPG